MVMKAINSPDFLVVIFLTALTIPTMVVTVRRARQPGLGDKMTGFPAHLVTDILGGWELTYRPRVSFSNANSSSLLKSPGVSPRGMAVLTPFVTRGTPPRTRTSTPV